MAQDQTTNTASTVSIVMPCFNRSGFLRDALTAIRDQTYTQWELILVDDGSTDDTRQAFDQLIVELNITQPVRFIYQDNAGPYAARNTGIALAQGRYLALYDSDDLWLPHHLADGVDALERHPEIHWVYADAKKVDLTTGKTVTPSNFSHKRYRHPFLSLNTIQEGKLHIFDDPDVVACQLRNNLLCLLQTSIIRTEVFHGHPFVDDDRNEGEDELYPIRAMKRGYKLAYLHDIHLIYRFHADNSSTAALGASVEKRLRVSGAAARGYEMLKKQISLSPRERQALNTRLANEYFWKRGYAILWENGLSRQAWPEFHRGLRYQPGNMTLWRTYLACRLKALLGRAPRPSQGQPKSNASTAKV